MCDITTAWNFYDKNFLTTKSSRSQVSERGRWNHITNFLGRCKLNDISNLQVLELKTHLASLPLSPQSVRHCLSLLQRVFNKARNLKLYQGDVPAFDMPRFDNRRVRFLSTDEAINLLDTLKAASPLWHDISLLALLTGLRAGEIFDLRPGNLNLENKSLHIFDTKSTVSRTIPLNPQACKLLKKCATEKKYGEYIFCQPDGKKIQQASRKFLNAVEECGLNQKCHDRRNRVVFHTLRHTFASWLVQEDVELNVVSRLLGHANIQMTMRYAHLSPTKGLDAVSKIRLGA